MNLNKYKKIIQETSYETKENINFSIDVLERIHELLNKKFNGKQKLLADKLGKSEAEVSKWFNGVQNYTFKTIFKLEQAFGEKIIAVVTEGEHSTFMQVKAAFKEACINFEVDFDGSLCENYSELKKFKIYPNNLKQDLSA